MFFSTLPHLVPHTVGLAGLVLTTLIIKMLRNYYGEEPTFIP